MNEIAIRPANVEDAEALLRVYAPYVLNTAITFEYDVPSVEEFRERIKTFQSKYPYIVAELEGKLVGYVYAHSFVGRKAYEHSAEMSVYLAMNMRHQGIGKKLYSVMERLLKAQGVINLYACIASPEVEDEFLTKNSIEFHKHLGYRVVGEFKNCAYKFNRWYNMTYMEKLLGDHSKDVPKFINFKDLLSSNDFDCTF